MAPLSSRLFKLKVGYRLGTIRPKTMSLELLAEQMQGEKEENEELGKSCLLSHSQKFLGAKSMGSISGTREQKISSRVRVISAPTFYPLAAQ